MKAERMKLAGYNNVTLIGVVTTTPAPCNRASSFGISLIFRSMASSDKGSPGTEVPGHRAFPDHRFNNANLF
jgi:hypothetical protein